MKEINASKRRFLKGSIITAAGISLATPASVLASSGLEFPGILYCKDNPGKWDGKAGSHAPVIDIAANRITITTAHPMSKAHYIARHTLVTTDGKVLGAKTFYPDDKAVSSYDIEVSKGVTLYATSFCNKHDMWITPFTPI